MFLKKKRWVGFIFTLNLNSPGMVPYAIRIPTQVALAAALMMPTQNIVYAQSLKADTAKIETLIKTNVDEEEDLKQQVKLLEG
jgi:hypothetical protein